ncbi:MAG: DNA-binding transcriptional ArsR family regulator [Bradymonadia bacterium]|jgi:DNA-binding transcriptional ArsR family regulator
MYRIVLLRELLNMATRIRLRSPRLVYDIDLLRAMADDTRQTILQFLCTPGAGAMRDFAVTEIADHFDLTTSTVSHHLQLLRRVGMVQMQKAGKERRYSLDFDTLRKSVGQFNDLLVMIEQSTDRAKSVIEAK